MKQTAVEWLLSQIPLGIRMNLAENGIDFQQALEMEREQIKDAWMDGMEGILHEIASEKYYNETYGH